MSGSRIGSDVVTIESLTPVSIIAMRTPPPPLAPAAGPVGASTIGSFTPTVTSSSGTATSFGTATAIAFTKGDFLAPAKVLTKFAKDNDKLVVMGGVMEGKAVDPAEVQTFASLPSKEELVAMLLRTINGPASGLARVINAIVEKKTAEGAA